MAYISFPFSIDNQGRVAVARTHRKVWIDRVRAVLSTQLGDRVMRPTFGLDSLSAVLNIGTPAEKSIEEQIRDAFLKHLPSLTLNKVSSYADTSSGTTVVDVVFTSPSGDIFNSTLSIGDDSLDLFVDPEVN
jgi:phage baseplate assembly protein W